MSDASFRILGSVETVLTGRIVSYTRPGTFSAIAKQPVAGRVAVRTPGLAGDEQGDRRVHGGPDKAVHFYAGEHYATWRRELGALRLLDAPGAFGENLATRGFDESGICLGDRLRIGTDGLLLEIAQGRQPCWKLNDRFGVANMARRVQDTLRTGWYARVLTSGSVGAGDDVVLVARPHPEWSIARLMGALYARHLDPQALRSMLELPLVPNWRRIVERRLDSGLIEDWGMRLDGPPHETGGAIPPPS